jgi:hypothetical protein
MLILEIAAGILLAVLVLAMLWLAFKGVRWVVRKVNERAAEEKYIKILAAEMKSDREGDADWLSSTKKKS